MKLFVDDLRDAPKGWLLVRKVQAAISLLYMMDAEEISLDHDIENRPDDETFYPIAHFIAMKHKATGWTPKVTIHSINPVGARAMANILKDNGIIAKVEPYKLAEFNKKYGLTDSTERL